MDLTMMERVVKKWEKMEGSCSTGQSPLWAVVPMEEEEEEEEEEQQQQQQNLPASSSTGLTKRNIKIIPSK
jgi:hypothetical protein